MLWISACSGSELIADFESSNALTLWKFGDGDEFFGADGELTLAPGRNDGKAAQLGYDFSDGGAYVEASRKLDRAIQAEAVSFWVNSPPGIRIRLRVIDSSGQILQYDLSRPFTAREPDNWYRHVVDLSAPSDYWDGADDGDMHGLIESISIMAGGALDEHHDQGAVRIDDVALIDDLDLTLDPYTTVKPPPHDFADCGFGLGVSVHNNYDDRTLNTVDSLGFDWVRMGLLWDQVEKTRGNYDWTRYDRAVAALAARGLGAHFHLSYGNPLYGGVPDDEESQAAYIAYAQAAAEHFAGKKVRFEIYNEPNLARFWPTPDAQVYSELAQAAIAAMRQADPHVIVSTGGLSGFDFTYLRTMLDHNAAGGADGVGLHPYRQGAPETISDGLLLARSVIKNKAAAALPIWQTEWGYSSTWFGGDGHTPSAKRRQAVMVARELATSCALGLENPIYYELRNFGTDAEEPEHNFGLIDHEYRYKPAAFAVDTFIENVSGRRFAGSLPLELSGLHALRFDGPQNTLVVVWTDNPDSNLEITIPASATAAFDLFGAPIELVRTGDHESKLTVSESAGPVYLMFPKDAALPVSG